MKLEHYKFPFHVILHPFDGFWDMKYEGKGKVRIALIILVMMVLNVVLQRQFAGFLVNFNDPRLLNSLDDIQYTVLPFLLFCISNWAITTLMEGEGKFSEIVMATGYALLPLVLINFPLTYISRFLTMEETAFYYLLNGFAVIWFFYLLFVGIMTVHQYTPFKTVMTLLLTVIAMGIVVFLGTLLFSMAVQMYYFVVDIYRELLFRM